MPATTTNLAIEQGADWSHGWAVTVNGDPIDETWTAAGQIRESVASEVILHTFTCDVTPEGAVVIGVSNEESTAWTWHAGRYDIEVENADQTLRLRVAQGSVRVSPEVTR